MLKPSDEKLNALLEGWGAGAGATLSDHAHADPIPARGERKVLCKLPSAFLANGKKIMLSAMTGLTLELELADADTCFAEDNYHQAHHPGLCPQRGAIEFELLLAASAIRKKCSA
jgi:hypothetical protein